MKILSAQIKIECPDSQHLPVSSFLKTIMKAVEASMEARSPDIDCEVVTKGLHVDAVKTAPGERHPLRGAMGL